MFEKFLNWIATYSSKLPDRTQAIGICIIICTFAMIMVLLRTLPLILSISAAFVLSVGFLFILAPFLYGMVIQARAADQLRKPDLYEIRRLRWRAFEHFTKLLFERLGYEANLLGGSDADGGVDLIVHRNGKRLAVQCKHYQRDVIGVNLVRELVGVASLMHADGCVFVTSGTFTRAVDAEFGAVESVQLWDGNKLVDLVHQFGVQDHPDATASVSTASEHTQQLCHRAMQDSGFLQMRVCPVCGSQMFLKIFNGIWWGCPNYATRHCKGAKLNEFERRVLFSDQKIEHARIIQAN